MKIEIRSQKYTLILIYYPLSLIPPILTSYLTPYITNYKYIIFYFIMAKNNQIPLKRFLSRKKAEEFYSNLIKESANKEKHIDSYISVNFSVTVDTKNTNGKENYHNIYFNGGKKLWESFDKEEQDYLSNLLKPLPKYINNTLKNIKARRDPLSKTINISNERKLKFK
ncbi:hypothetical protein [Pectobacterium carotovorum]|uniref:hypothetical protein n=1 Tax=Pectobacterium carotovorum TaxID=554 RepID=UPI0037FA8A25